MPCVAARSRSCSWTPRLSQWFAIEATRAEASRVEATQLAFAGANSGRDIGRAVRAARRGSNDGAGDRLAGGMRRGSSVYSAGSQMSDWQGVMARFEIL